MSKFLILYRSNTSAQEQMANTTPEQAQAGMQAWNEWFTQAGSAVVDDGSPVSGDDRTIAGYSVLQADTRQELDQLLEGHPHRTVGTIEVLEFLTMPGI